MTTILKILSEWKDLIVKVFGSYPLAGALVTIVAVCAFIVLQTQYRKGKTASNTLCVLLAWSLAVPLLGSLLEVGGEAYETTKSVLSFLWSALSSFYRVYEKHPIAVLVLLGAATSVYFLWGWRRPYFIRSKPLRILSLWLATVAAALIVSPLLDLLGSPTLNTEGPSSSPSRPAGLPLPKGSTGAAAATITPGNATSP